MPCQRPRCYADDASRRTRREETRRVRADKGACGKLSGRDGPGIRRNAAAGRQRGLYIANRISSVVIRRCNCESRSELIDGKYRTADGQRFGTRAPCVCGNTIGDAVIRCRVCLIPGLVAEDRGKCAASRRAGRKGEQKYSTRQRPGRCLRCWMPECKRRSRIA